MFSQRQAAAFYAVVMITLYVVFGGLGDRLMGLSKILLTCIGMLSVGILAYL